MFVRVLVTHACSLCEQLGAFVGGKVKDALRIQLHRFQELRTAEEACACVQRAERVLGGVAVYKVWVRGTKDELRVWGFCGKSVTGASQVAGCVCVCDIRVGRWAPKEVHRYFCTCYPSVQDGVCACVFVCKRRCKVRGTEIHAMYYSF